MAWAPPSQPGDRDPAIAAAKTKLRRYSYGKALDTSDEYTVEFGVALMQFKVNRNEQILRGTVKNMPGMTVNGVLDWAAKKNLEILPAQVAPQRPRKLILTIQGHMGGLFDGPAYFTARDLELRGLARVQPVGYDNFAKPFNNGSGVAEAERLVNDPNILAPGEDWAVLAHSQGAIVFCDWWEQRIASNRDRWPYSGFRGGINFGNPRRPKGVVAPWIADKPSPNSEGLDPDCLDEPIPGVQEASRDGDLYTNKKPGTLASEYTQAVYLAVARGRFIGNDTLAEEIAELAFSFGNPAEIFAIFQAIMTGVIGLARLREHVEFDLRPCIDHTARILGV